MDDDIDGDAPPTPEVHRPANVGRRKGHRRPWVTEGPMQLIMLFASSVPTAFAGQVFSVTATVTSGEPVCAIQMLWLVMRQYNVF